MQELFQTIDWQALFSAVWTIVLVPIWKMLYDYCKSKRVDGYADILYEEVVKAVKSIQEVYVNDIKNTDEWNDETKEQMKSLAKDKAIQALSSIAYRTLKEANEDFDEYLDSLIGTALFDVKNGLK